MKPKGSLPCLKVLATGSYPEPNVPKLSQRTYPSQRPRITFHNLVVLM